MSTSSALKTSHNFSDSDKASTEQFALLSEAGSVTSNKVEFPNFDAYGGKATYAITARLAGRVNASNVSPDEERELLREREALIIKRIGNEITRREINRLEYIRWSLDRIEDARHGHSLDSLEGLVEFYEKFEADVESLKLQLEQMRKRK